MEQNKILDRIKQLSTLCEETEPTSKELMYMDKLFTEDLIDVDKMYLQVRNEKNSREEIIDIMRECNWIWKKRLKVKEIGWTEYNDVGRKIEEALRANRKIDAIKLYRRYKIDNGDDCSLKEAKDYIDKLQIKMGLD
tara:strand:+ start:1046 stop:1456 length:411 start_codon:yes stop_codon:yes gene_type:complete